MDGEYKSRFTLTRPNYGPGLLSGESESGSYLYKEVEKLTTQVWDRWAG